MIGSWIDSWNPYNPKKLQGKGLQPISVEESSIRRTAAWWFLSFFAVFLGWSLYAPIDAGVTVPGTVAVVGNRKQVQSLRREMGIETIWCRPRRTNPLKNTADLTGVQLQYINLLATESRLRAERDNKGVIQWGDELSRRFKPNNERVRDAKELQVRLFESRKSEFNSQVASLNEQIGGLTEVMVARRTQQRSLKEEMTNTNKLASDGFVPKSQANQAERQNSDIESSIASTQAEIARAKLQISQLRSTFLKDVDNQLQEIQKNKDALLTRLEASQFDRDLAAVRAPVSGSVVGLKVFTVGGVITSGQVLMEVVPKDESFVVNAKIPATIIDKVKVGMPTDMRFTSFNQTTTPVIPGMVKVVGADKEPGQNANDEYYLGLVEVTSEGFEKLAGLKLQAGMPVDVVIKSGERTFMSYLLKPLSDRFATAFKN
ncbi:MAG: HlyD family type I secretion periplasmic adaptor subunit [Betaproteobacteria bacterium]|nr:HlyD family type I secretion periplasmic adaptor subunit [Betaproteobacteria bacterium]